MKGIITVDVDGCITGADHVEDNVFGIIPVYEPRFDSDNLKLYDQILIGYQISIEPPEGLYKPQFNLETEKWGEGRAASDILEDIRQSKISILNNACNASILSGFTSNALGDEHTYDFDYEAQTNLGGMLNAIMAEIVTEEIDWKASGLPVPHTINQFKQVYADGLTHKNSLITKYWMLKSQVLSAHSVEDIESVFWSK